MILLKPLYRPNDFSCVSETVKVTAAVAVVAPALGDGGGAEVASGGTVQLLKGSQLSWCMIGPQFSTTPSWDCLQPTPPPRVGSIGQKPLVCEVTVHVAVSHVAVFHGYRSLIRKSLSEKSMHSGPN